MAYLPGHWPREPCCRHPADRDRVVRSSVCLPSCTWCCGQYVEDWADPKSSLRTLSTRLQPDNRRVLLLYLLESSRLSGRDLVGVEVPRPLAIGQVATSQEEGSAIGPGRPDQPSVANSGHLEGAANATFGLWRAMATSGAWCSTRCDSDQHVAGLIPGHQLTSQPSMIMAFSWKSPACQLSRTRKATEKCRPSTWAA